MTTATHSIEVNVPLSVAYNQWTQMESYPRFMTGVESVKQLSDKRTSWHMSMGGVKREFTAEVTEQLPDKRIAWRAEGELKQSGEVSFAPIDDDTTRVELTLEWEPSGLAENVAAAFQVDDVVVEADLRRFKELIESESFPEGAWRGEIKDKPSGTL